MRRSLLLQGRMSVVGPRPHAVAHNEQYRKLIKGTMLRHKVKPGITGWAQVNGLRGETETLDKMRAHIAAAGPPPPARIRAPIAASTQRA